MDYDLVRKWVTVAFLISGANFLADRRKATGVPVRLLARRSIAHVPARTRVDLARAILVVSMSEGVPRAVHQVHVYDDGGIFVDFGTGERRTTVADSAVFASWEELREARREFRFVPQSKIADGVGARLRRRG